MKVVLFCGGQGTRLRDYSDQIPKPLVPVGDLPILWHMMKYYAAFGHKDFILCLGYKGEAIKRFFLEYNAAMSNDFVLENGGARLDGPVEPDIRDWRITFVDTGQSTNIGGRLLRVRKHLENEEMFLCNYADILTDLDLDAMVRGFRASDAIGGFCAVTPPYSFHLVKLREGDKVERMMSLQESGTLMNGGYIILRPQIFDNLFEGEELVVEGFARLVEQNRLYAHRHDGFWMPMDTFKEKQALDDMLRAATRPGRSGRRAGRMLSLRWPDLRTRPLPRGAQRRHRDRCRRDGAPARAREPAGAHRLGGARRERAARRGGARLRGALPRQAPAKPRCCCRSSATGISRRSGSRSRPSSRR